MIIKIDTTSAISYLELAFHIRLFYNRHNNYKDSDRPRGHQRFLKLTWDIGDPTPGAP